MTILDGNAPGPGGQAGYLDGNADGIIGGQLGLVWVGADGSSWDLMGGPVRASMAGIKGLGMPDVKFQVSTNAGRDGQRLRGLYRNPRSVFIPVRFKGEWSTDVLGIQRRFWRSLGLGEYGTLVVTTPDGQARSLRCRFEDDGNYAYVLDPFTAQVTTIGLTLTADDPYWYGDRIGVSYSLDPSEQVNFFGDGDPAEVNAGPPFVISASSGTQAYVMSNPGDVDAWPRWSITGPAVAFRVGVDGHAIAADYTIPAGKTLVIDTDPTVQTATLDGAPVRFQAFSTIDFASIPRGEAVQLMVNITGSGIVAASIEPRYERAF